MDSDTRHHLLHDSKTFCMYPWIHLYVSPKGQVYPCCTTSQTESLGSIKTHSLKEIFNNEQTKKLRMDMAKGIPNDICKMCYKMEESSPNSYRNYSKKIFEHRFDEIVPETMNDGAVNPFKMRLIDVRFSNICNFACRTCGSECSSMWAAEERQAGKIDWITLHADDHKGKLLEEVLEHVDHADMVYFAGGEPLITDEHYSILEEMLVRGRTDIKLRYNTNCSTINYKDKELLKLWKNFKHIDLACSIDHYGEKAELLRHGTDWGVVETNLHKFRNLENVNFSISTVLSVFNYLTIHDFYDYMIKKNLILPDDKSHYLTITSNPSYFAATALPPSLKGPGTRILEAYADSISDYPSVSQQLKYAANFAGSAHTWDQHKYDFVKNIYVRDRLRKEDVMAVFPELTAMFDN